MAGAARARPADRSPIVGLWVVDSALIRRICAGVAHKSPQAVHFANSGLGLSSPRDPCLLTCLIAFLMQQDQRAAGEEDSCRPRRAPGGAGRKAEAEAQRWRPKRSRSIWRQRHAYDASALMQPAASGHAKSHQRPPLPALSLLLVPLPVQKGRAVVGSQDLYPVLIRVLDESQVLHLA